jgi:hypothetical protein
MQCFVQIEYAALSGNCRMNRHQPTNASATMLTLGLCGGIGTSSREDRGSSCAWHPHCMWVRGSLSGRETGLRAPRTAPRSPRHRSPTQQSNVLDPASQWRCWAWLHTHGANGFLIDESRLRCGFFNLVFEKTYSICVTVSDLMVP